MTEVQAVLATGIFATIVAIWGVLSQRAISCRRATVEYLALLESDKDHIGARKKFIELAKLDGGLAPWAAADREKSDETQSIRLVLNSYELIAIGMQRGVFDRTLYIRWHKSGVLQAWNHALPFVSALRNRTENAAIYHEFEELVKTLKKNSMPRRNWWWGRFF